MDVTWLVDAIMIERRYRPHPSASRKGFLAIPQVLEIDRLERPIIQAGKKEPYELIRFYPRSSCERCCLFFLTMMHADKRR